MGPNHNEEANDRYEQTSDNVEAGCNDYETAADYDPKNYPDD